MFTRAQEDPTVQREFQAFSAKTERVRTLVGTAVAIVFWLFFSYLDFEIYPEELSVLLPLRLAVLIVFLVTFAITFGSTSYSWIIGSAAFAWTIATVAIAVMCHVAEGYASPYYVGIIFCAVFAGSVLLWPAWLVAACFLATLVVYYGPLLLGAPLGDPRVFLLNTSFLLATLAVSVLAAGFRRRLAFAAFSSRRELARSHRELQLLDASKNRMFQNVSHELRTPLTLMLSPLQRGLESHPPRGVEPTQAAALYRHGLRLLKQVDDLLNLAQLSARKLPVLRSALSLNQFLADLVDDALDAAESHGIVLTKRLPDPPIFYSVDANHLERIVLNLLSNAIKHAGSSCTVEVACRARETMVEIEVSDNGPGIDSVDQARIFERFEQGSDSDARVLGGTGIGLALVRELTWLLGGTVSVQSTPGQGARFLVALPPEHLCSELDHDRESHPSGNKRLEQNAQRAALARSTLSERTSAGRVGPRILVAEDDPDLRDHLTELLCEQNRVIAVSDGHTALSEACGWLPHLVITDVMMPGLNGIELCRELRQVVALENTAVLMLTARTTLDDRIAGREVGADSYLTKPFERAELCAAVEGLLKARHHLVGEFLIRRPLGSGGQGKVFLAEHRTTGRLAAVKRVTSKRTGASQGRLRNEINALTRLDHDNIVKILGGYEQEGEWFLAMEYLSGTTVTALLEQGGPLPSQVAAAIGSRVALALDAVHLAGLLHRDVKCSNIMLLTKRPIFEAVRLIDFGSAAMRGQNATETQGTLPYVAPEVALGTSGVGPLSDIYSLGVALFRMCTGHLPCPATNEALRELWQQESPPRISEVQAEVAPSLDDAVARAMDRSPARRWQSAAELAALLSGETGGSESTALQFAAIQPDILTPTDSVSSWGS